MKITKVREGVTECALWEVSISDDAARVIADAVSEDHPVADGETRCGNTCDICWALESGYPFAAAWLLCGATDTPALSAALTALEFNGVDVPFFGDQFDEWCTSPDSDSVRCPGCDARAYTNFEDGCGNCGAELTIDIDAMTDAYADTALWSSLGEDGESLSGLYGTADLDSATAEEIRGDCAAFAVSNIIDLQDVDPARAGEDFWLTRNHHGAGFSDRGLGDKGERLTTSAHPFGSVELYVGDNGVVYA
jgi:hypothetical protein